MLDSKVWTIKQFHFEKLVVYHVEQCNTNSCMRLGFITNKLDLMHRNTFKYRNSVSLQRGTKPTKFQKISIFNGKFQNFLTAMKLWKLKINFWGVITWHKWIKLSESSSKYQNVGNMCGSTGRESCRSQFDSLPLHEWESSRKGGEYDIRSVMHYGKFFFNFEKIPLSVVGVFDFKRLLISTNRFFGGALELLELPSLLAPESHLISK